MFCFKQLFEDKEEVASGISFHPPFPLRHLTKPVTVQALSNAMVGLPNLKGQPCKPSSLPIGTNNSLAYSYQDCHGRHSFSRFLQLERCLFCLVVLITLASFNVFTLICFVKYETITLKCTVLDLVFAQRAGTCWEFYVG